jgi:hypothetical protein
MRTYLSALPAEVGLRCRAGRCAGEPAGTAQGSVLGEVEAALAVHLQGLHRRVGELGRDIVQDAVSVERELPVEAQVDAQISGVSACVGRRCLQTEA